MVNQRFDKNCCYKSIFCLALQVANDLSNLTALDKKYFEVNLTRGLAYRSGLEWHNDTVRAMKALLTDFKVMSFIEFFEKKRILLSFTSKARDVRIIIGNFNQTIASHMFCQVCLVNLNRITYLLSKYRLLVNKFMDHVINGLFSVIHLHQFGGMNQLTVQHKN